MKQIVCDRCGAAFEAKSRDIALYSVTVTQFQEGRECMAAKPDLCTDCAGFVVDAFKLALLPVVRAPTREQLRAGLVETDRTTTYEACGCDIRDHAPGECAKTTVLPPKGFAAYDPEKAAPCTCSQERTRCHPALCTKAMAPGMASAAVDNPVRQL